MKWLYKFKNKQLAKSIKQTLKDPNSTRQLLLTNKGTIFIGFLEMKSMSNKLSPFIPSNMEEYKKAQLNVNAWREGNRIINRIGDNKNKTKDPQSYMPNPGSNLKEYCNNYCRVKDILRNCK